MDWVCVYAKPSSSHDLQTSIICDPIKYSLPDSSIYQSTILNITDTLILVNINFLLALMQSKTNLTTTVFIHILVLVPILGIGAWFVCLSFVKCGVFKYLRHVLVKKGQQPLAASREQCYKEWLPSTPNVPVQDIHLYENNEE